MIRLKFLAISTLLLLVLGAGCIFGSRPVRGVMSYRDGRVYLRKYEYYRVGQLPPGWERMRTRVRTISFYNRDYESSISTDAFCGKAVAERRLDSLGGDMISALENREVISEEKFDLDERGANRLLVQGDLEGVRMVVDLVMVQKNGCVFDFYAVMPGHVRPDVTRAFEDFFQGFHYE